MQSINLKVKVNNKELDRLKNTEANYQQTIVNDSLLIQFVLIYFNTLTLTLKNEIKSEIIANYLKTARAAFDEDLHLTKFDDNSLELLDPKKNLEFKDLLEAENEMVQTLVRNLNKVYAIQYDKYAWKTFNFFYYVTDESVKTVNKNIEKLLMDAEELNRNFTALRAMNANSEEEVEVKQKPDKKANFLPLEEKNEDNVPLILAPKQI